MRYFFKFSILLLMLSSCSSDDEACATETPVDIKEGEGRISVIWQDFTDSRSVTAYEYQLVLSGEAPSDSFGRETTPITTAPDNNRFFIQSYTSLPYDTEFDLYYRVDCGGILGEVLGPIALRSLAFGEGCTPPSDLVITAITENSISLEWEGYDENLWAVSWGANDGIDGGDVDVTETAFVITDLRPNTAYLIGVKARCIGSDFVTSELGLNPIQTVSTLED